MAHLLKLTLVFLFACTTAPVRQLEIEQRFDQIKMSGEGKARMEIPPQSWVFSFESFFKDKTWTMLVNLPIQGEEVFSFPELGSVRPSIPASAQDFRWRIIQALRQASVERHLGHPQLGQDFINYLHYFLRFTHANELGLKRSCEKKSDVQWECGIDSQKERSQWSWDQRKEALTGIFSIREGWDFSAKFTNLTDSVFKRVTLELIRKTEDSTFVELRLEIFLRD